MFICNYITAKEIFTSKDKDILLKRGIKIHRLASVSHYKLATNINKHEFIKKKTELKMKTVSLTIKNQCTSKF